MFSAEILLLISVVDDNFFLFLISGVIDYNFLCFREAIQKVFDLRIVENSASYSKENSALRANGLGSLPAASLSN